MSTIISFGIQKGGVGKTTTTAITGFLLSQEYRVLLIDFDSQGNLTSMATGDPNIYQFDGKTSLEMMKCKDVKSIAHVINENLHLIPATDFLSQLPYFLYREYTGNPLTVLSETLEKVSNDYDFILIDCPPNLGETTQNALVASDFVIPILQSEPFCFDALERYLEFIMDGIKAQANSKIRLAGILTCMLDSRAAIDNHVLEKAREEYQDLLFSSVIKRRTRIKEYSLTGVSQRTKQDTEALEQYSLFVKELLKRVQS